MVVLGHVTSTEAGVSRVLLLWLLSVLSSKIVGGIWRSSDDSAETELVS